MKYDVTYSCGHSGTIRLEGKMTDRQRKLDYLAKYGICTDCYRERMHAEERAEGLIINISYESISRQIIMYATGDAYNHKDQLKALGLVYGEVALTGGSVAQDVASYLDPRRMAKPLDRYWYIAWSVTTDPQVLAGAIKDLIDKIREACGDIKYVDQIDDVRRQIMAKDREACLAEQAASQQAAAAQQATAAQKAAAEQAARPAILTGRWNGKIYGSERHGYRVYIGGKETPITAGEKEELEKYLVVIQQHA